MQLLNADAVTNGAELALAIVACGLLMAFAVVIGVILLRDRNKSGYAADPHFDDIPRGTFKAELGGRKEDYPAPPTDRPHNADEIYLPRKR